MGNKPAKAATASLLAVISILGLGSSPGRAQSLFEPYPAQAYVESDWEPNDVVSAQLIGNADADLAVSHIEGSCVQLFEKTGLTYTLAQTLTLKDRPNFLAAGDFTRDGLLDLAMTHTWNNSLTILRNLGDGFTPWATFRTGQGPWDFTCVDVDQDGHLDIVLGHGWTSHITIFYGADQPGFSPILNYDCPYDPFQPFVRDLDADGVNEIVLIHNDTQLVTVLESTGKRDFWVDHSFGVPGHPKGGTLVDLDEDGRLDLAVALDNNWDTNDRISIHPGDGAGGFLPPSLFSAPGHPVSLTHADLDVDGNTDLLATCYEGGTLNALLGNGYGDFDLLDPIPVGSGSRGLALDDFDGDGDLDAAVCAREENRIYFMANTTDPVTPTALSFFELSLRGTSVLARWQTQDPLPVEDLRLLRGEDPLAADIPITSDGVGTYSALDTDPRPAEGSTQVYRLLQRSEDGWQLLRQSLLELPVREAALAHLAAQPNPFNPGTTIRVALATAGPYRLDVFDHSGRRLRSLLNGNGELGDLQLVWDGRDDAGDTLAGGVYLARLAAKDVRETVKLILLK